MIAWWWALVSFLVGVLACLALVRAFFSVLKVRGYFDDGEAILVNRGVFEWMQKKASESYD